MINSFPFDFDSKKYDVSKLVTTVEEEIDFNSIKGHTQFNKKGFNKNENKYIPPKKSKKYRDLVSSTIKDIQNEKDICQAVQLSVQGQWSNWKNYISSEFSWKCLFALPPNLTSFCIGSTFDTLATPNNLRRWGYTKDSKCMLCSAISCSVSHILSGCHFSLKGGRFKYHHDKVLSVFVTHLKQFVGTIVPVKPHHGIKFVKAGHTYRKRSSSKKLPGLLFLVKDWQVYDDLDDSLQVPEFLTVTSLRPDVLLMSPTIKRVILIELTCPAEENLTDRHFDKIEKYSPLREAIEASGWTCDLFAIEVGARGFCSKFFIQALKELGFCNKLISTIKAEVSYASLRASFWIWMAREDKEWRLSKHHSLPSSSTNHMKNIPNSSINIDKDSKFSKVNNPPSGLPNLGNTCYLNAIIQTLSSIPSFWLTASNSPATLNPFVKSFSLLCSQVFKRSKPVINPSFFVSSFASFIKKRTRNFMVNQQQDCAEVLNYILEGLFELIPELQKLCSVVIETKITCSACLNISSSKETMPILILPVSSSLNQSLNDYLSTEVLKGEKAYYCQLCKSFCEAKKSSELLSLPNVLFVQFKRFLFEKGVISVNRGRISFPYNNFKQAISDERVTLNMKYHLTSCIIHTGSTTNGHYKAAIRRENEWYLCDDKKCSKVNLREITDQKPYLLAYGLD